MEPLQEVYVDLCRLEDAELGLVETPEADAHCGVMAVTLTREEVETYQAKARRPDAVLVPEGDLPRRKQGGRRPGGNLGRASGRVLERAARNPGGPRKALGEGLAKIRREKEGDMRLRNRMASLFTPARASAEVTLSQDWTAVPEGDGRRVEIDGGASFEVAE